MFFMYAVWGDKIDSDTQEQDTSNRNSEYLPLFYIRRICIAFLSKRYV